MDATTKTSEFVNDLTMPAPIKLSHISIGTNENYEQMVSFYRDLLNMRVVYEINGRIRFCMMSFDDEHHRIGIAQFPQLMAKEPGRTGLEHSSYSYSSVVELFAVVRRFHEKTGLWPESTVHQGPVIAISYRDPDGNRAEIACDIVGSQADVVQYFHDHYWDPAFNTILPFDVVKMIALYEGGMPLDELTRYETVVELVAEGRL